MLNIGHDTNGALRSSDAIINAGLNWTADKEPIYTCDGIEVESHRAVRRSDTGDILGVVGARYQVLQNAEAFAWFDPFTAAGEASYETAGALAGGKRVWILAKLNRSDAQIVGDDVVAKYVLLSNSHNGSLAVRVGFTPIRVVCQNTLNMAHHDDASKLIRIRHTSGLAETMERVRETMNMADAMFEATADQYRVLASRQLSRRDLATYVSRIFDLDPPDGEEGKGRVQEAVRQAFETGAGNEMPGVRGTWWAAYNAVTDYLSHTRGSSEESRLNSLWYGDGAQKNAKALDLAYQYVIRA